jgi:hypothetical protein
MRIFTLLTSLLLINSFLSQEPILNEYVVATSDRKFIWIIDNPTGQLIYNNWQINPEYNGFIPVVSLVSDLEPYRKKVKKKVKNSKKSK